VVQDRCPQAIEIPRAFGAFRRKAQKARKAAVPVSARGLFGDAEVPSRRSVRPHIGQRHVAGGQHDQQVVEHVRRFGRQRRGRP
jgi:hypothetical protein